MCNVKRDSYNNYFKNLNIFIYCDQLPQKNLIKKIYFKNYFIEKYQAIRFSLLLSFVLWTFSDGDALSSLPSRVMRGFSSAFNLAASDLIDPMTANREALKKRDIRRIES